MNDFLIFSIHFAFGIGLFIITNWIGRHSYSIGYMEISIFVKSETAPAFNFLFRVLSPVVYIIIISAILYRFNLDIFVINIYLVVVYYIVFRLLFNVITNRTRLINWKRQSIHTFCMCMISWLAYESIIKNKKNVLPDFGTISNELWIIILLFLFQVLNNLTFSSEDSEKRKEHYLKTRHNTFRNKYGKLVSDLTPNVRVEALVYSIMIYEDFNRPKAIRIIENVKFRATRKPMTLGVMQVRSEEFIDDFGSVKKGVEKLVSDLREVLQENNNGGRSTYHTMEILSSVIKKFNGGKSYNKEISDLFWIVWLKIYGGTTEISFAD